MSPTAEMINKFADQVEATNARTMRICGGEPTLRATLTAFMRLEKDANAHGWDQPPTVLLLFRDSRSGKIKYLEDTCLTDVVRNTDERPAHVLAELAEALEALRSYAFSLDDQSAPDPRVVEAMKFVPRYADQLRKRPNADLVAPLASHWPFYGYGLMSESYGLLGVSAEILEAVGSRQVRRHPDRVEFRDLHVLGRDGLHWFITRFRCTAEASVPRMCSVSTRDDAVATGGIPHALSRLTAATSSNMVPIIPTATAADVAAHIREQGRPTAP